MGAPAGGGAGTKSIKPIQCLSSGVGAGGASGDQGPPYRSLDCVMQQRSRRSASPRDRAPPTSRALSAPPAVILQTPNLNRAADHALRPASRPSPSLPDDKPEDDLRVLRLG